MPSRRTLLQTALLTLPLLPFTRAWARLPGDPAEALAALEARHGGRLGVAALDTFSGRVLANRSDERFAMCSTFKLLLAGQVLAAVDAGRERLDRRLAWTTDEVISWSPVIDKHDGKLGLSVETLCEATMTLSDNTAANLLLAEHGGPRGLTDWLASIGDAVTRLDRNEPGLNEATPGDPRDTTTPDAMVATMRKLLLGDVLSPASRTRLTGWMLANQTGDKRLRAGLPGWRVGDKTGTNNTGNANDIGILRAPDRSAPILVAAYYAESTSTHAERDAVLADVGRVVGAWALAGG
ncbi:class A beta-lactamase [Arenimonas aestuarii]